AFARDRVDGNARSQLEETISRDVPAVRRLAGVDAHGLVAGGPAPAPADYWRAARLADRLWLLSPRLAGGARSRALDAARTPDEALFELRVLGVARGATRAPPTPPATALDASRATYESAARPDHPRLPDWDTISKNPAMRRAAHELAVLRTTLARRGGAHHGGTPRAPLPPPGGNRRGGLSRAPAHRCGPGDDHRNPHHPRADPAPPLSVPAD